MISDLSEMAWATLARLRRERSMPLNNNRHRELADASRDEAKTLVRAVAEPRAAFEAITIMIARAATRLDWTYGRTEDIWRREARRIDAWEMDVLRKTARRYRRRKSRT